MKRTIEERFWEKVDKTDNDFECWLWVGARTGGWNGDRYGHMWVDGKMMYAHRVSYMIEYGGIPALADIHHTCRNPLCVNPAHLESVGLFENRQDQEHDK